VNFATWVIRSLRNCKAISVVEDHYNSPTLADNLAETILEIMGANATGAYHVLGSERISRYDFAMKIAEIFGLNRLLITPVKIKDLKVWVANRPKDLSLSVDKIRRELEVSPLDLNEALKRMKCERPK